MPLQPKKNLHAHNQFFRLLICWFIASGGFSLWVYVYCLIMIGTKAYYMYCYIFEFIFNIFIRQGFLHIKSEQMWNPFPQQCTGRFKSCTQAKYSLFKTFILLKITDHSSGILPSTPGQRPGLIYSKFFPYILHYTNQLCHQNQIGS